jgi:hypothetical protein
LNRKALVVVTVIVVAVLLSASFLLTNPSLFGAAPKKTPPLPEAPVYVGVTYCGDNVTEAKMLIDKVKDYTNLFVIQSGTLFTDVQSTNAICSYAVESGLHIIVYFSAALDYRQYLTSFLSTADAWGSNMLGIYFDDEPGGKMLDSQNILYFYDDTTKSIIEKAPNFIGVIQEDGAHIVYLEDDSVEVSGALDVFYQINETVNYEALTSAEYVVKPNGTIYIRDSNGNIVSQLTDSTIIVKIDSYKEVMAKKPFQTYDETARVYVDTIRNSTGWFHSQTSVKAFTSDYALYWFNFKGGFDVVLAELGWNHTTAQDIALARGAANLQGKEWGAIVTWKYTYPERINFPSGEYGPYLASGEEIYSQLRQAYEAGAKYLVVFNYPTYPADNPYGVMQPEHFGALQRLWNDTVNNQTVVHGGVKAEAVLVFPENYGWGMRNPQDNIWGLWEADDLSGQVWSSLQNALATYGSRLDIVYEDSSYPAAPTYSHLFFWNQTS